MNIEEQTLKPCEVAVMKALLGEKPYNDIITAIKDGSNTYTHIYDEEIVRARAVIAAYESSDTELQASQKRVERLEKSLRKADIEINRAIGYFDGAEVSQEFRDRFLEASKRIQQALENTTKETK